MGVARVLATQTKKDLRMWDSLLPSRFDNLVGSNGGVGLVDLVGRGRDGAVSSAAGRDSTVDGCYVRRWPSSATRAPSTYALPNHDLFIRSRKRDEHDQYAAGLWT